LDETMRRLLDEHLAAQEVLDTACRLTHVSTVMRYPLPLPGRRQPRQGVQLRLRLDAGIADRARDVSLQLPGQHLRGHRDYQARLLTDAVMTAIARQEPISDEVLDGVMPLLRHGAALGLWRLVTAATSTRSELEVFKRAESSRTARMAGEPSNQNLWVERVAAALREEDDVAWHAAYRSEAAQFLARRLLPVDADAMENVLFEQDSNSWRNLLASPPMAGFRGREQSFEGRGGSAVWRAKRRVEQDEMLRWLSQSHRPEACRVKEVDPPGWTLRIPDHWQSVMFPARRPLPPVWAAHLDAGRVVDIGAGGRPELWPTVDGPDGEIIPVPRFEHVSTVAPSIGREELIEMVLVDLTYRPLIANGEPTKNSSFDADSTMEHFGPFAHELDTGSLDEDLLDADWIVDDFRYEPYVEGVVYDQYVDEWEAGPIMLTAHRAFNLGLIDESERDALLEQARLATQDAMREIVASLVGKNDALGDELRAAMDEPYRFVRLAGRAKQFLSITESSWTWPVTSIAAAIADHAVSARAVEHLARLVVLRCKRRLERSMEQAARAAFDRFPERQ
jgi:hypothetical protein